MRKLAYVLNLLKLLFLQIYNCSSNIQAAFLTCREAIMLGDMADDKVQAQIITVSFNLARVDEKLKRLTEAESIYKSITKKVPKYTDSKFYLKCFHTLK